MSVTPLGTTPSPSTPPPVVYAPASSSAKPPSPPLSPTRPAIAAASAHVLGKAQTYLANAEDIIVRADDENKPLRATGLLTLAAIKILGTRDSVAQHAAFDANLAAQAERLEQCSQEAGRQG